MWWIILETLRDGCMKAPAAIPTCTPTTFARRLAVYTVSTSCDTTAGGSIIPPRPQKLVANGETKGKQFAGSQS